MKIGKITLAAIAATIFNMLVGWLTCGGIFNWVYKLEPTSVWRPMDGPPGVVFMMGGFLLTWILVLVYALLRRGIPGKNRFIRGLVFGLCVWAVGMLPGMFSMYTFMMVSSTVIVYWTILGLIKMPLECMIIAAIYGE